MFSFNKKTQKRIVSTFKRETKDARKIAEKLDLKRHHVMRFLEDLELRRYSEGSYR
jgi:hypothetical protein